MADQGDCQRGQERDGDGPDMLDIHLHAMAQIVPLLSKRYEIAVLELEKAREHLDRAHGKTGRDVVSAPGN